jgi:hypothetical protein
MEVLRRRFSGVTVVTTAMKMLQWCYGGVVEGYLRHLHRHPPVSVGDGVIMVL